MGITNSTLVMVFFFMAIVAVMGQNVTTITPATQTTRVYRFVVPARELNDFVKVRRMIDGSLNFSGFSIEVFNEAAKAAYPTEPLRYEFVPYTSTDGRTMNGTFDQMLQAVLNTEYDGAVGDISALYYRMDWVDFTMPYLDSDIGLLVRVDPSDNNNIGLTPAAKAYLALVVALAFLILVASFILTKKPTTKLLVIVLVSMAMLLIVASNMPATPSSSLPTQRLVSNIKSLSDLKRTEARVGYRQGAYVRELLISKGDLSESQLIPLFSEAEMLHKLQLGGQTDDDDDDDGGGGIDALVAGTQSLKFLQAKYCDNFTIVPTFRIPSAGYAFAFPKNQSPRLVDAFSEAILKLIDNEKIAEIQARTIGDLDNVCEGKIRTIVGSTLQDRLSLWLPIASDIFIITIVIFILLCFTKQC